MLALALTLMTLIPQAPAAQPCGPGPWSGTPATTAPASELRLRASLDLDQALQAFEAAGAGKASADPAAWEALRASARSIADRLGAASQNAQALRQALEACASAAGEAQTRAAQRSLTRELGRLAIDLPFEPKLESPRPLGFPAATPVGEFALLEYPRYRMARVPMANSGRGNDNGAFWKLFQHIQSKDIPMTAPVEMSYRQDPLNGKLDEGSMAFLYVSTDVGRLGDDQGVEVLEVPATRVVSIGLRGNMSAQRLQVEVERLSAWVAEQPEKLEIAGPPRSMGWNSPMVPVSKRFWEVQLPVRALP